ncbi:MAG: hypothetical protein GF370_01410 [Candidatus Nealsonbacteria bacterium]|nr:hypothetical protein [Candidatus Nealsonbacteria bacterium]
MEKECEEFSIYQICNKNKKKVDPINADSKRRGPTFSLVPGKNHELVIRSQGRIESGVFSVSETGIEMSDSHPPPVRPMLIKK